MLLILPLVSPLPRKLISANPGLCEILNKIPLPKTSPNWAQAHKHECARLLNPKMTAQKSL